MTKGIWPRSAKLAAIAFAALSATAATKSNAAVYVFQLGGGSFTTTPISTDPNLEAAYGPLLTPPATGIAGTIIFNSAVLQPGYTGTLSATTFTLSYDGLQFTSTSDTVLANSVTFDYGNVESYDFSLSFAPDANELITYTATNNQQSAAFSFDAGTYIASATAIGSDGVLTQKSGTTLAEPIPAPGVPEPATWLMMIIGSGGLGVALRRQRQTGVLA